ncbi:MAG: CHASE3 domain-containing protein [Pirellulales bacterium]
MPDQRTTTDSDRKSSIGLAIGLAAVLIMFVVSGIVAYLNTRTLRETSVSVTRTHEVLVALTDVLSLVKDAETGQRGYIVTGQESYLQPHSTAVNLLDKKLAEIESYGDEFPELKDRMAGLRANLDLKLKELAETIDVRRSQGFEAAQLIVVSDRGRDAMERIRRDIREMQIAVRSVRNQRLDDAEQAFQTAVISGVLTGLLGVLLSIVVAWLIRRSMLQRRRQAWLQNGHIGLNGVTAGDLRLEQLGDNVLRFFAEYVQAQAGAFFVRDGAKFRRVATYGVPAQGGVPAEFDGSDGLLGQASKDGKTFILQKIPDGYLTLGSSFGRDKPRHLAIVPTLQDKTVNGIMELGSLNSFDDAAQKLFESVSDTIAASIKAANYRSHLQNLLDETQRQAEELQTQSEELRVSNEELEEQSRALKESQTRLETQQAELEQTNSQLEEQAQLLEAQKDDVNRAKNALEMQARDLEQASRYKSDFLANMSHELRTPLNSSLILAKLLSENALGNLTDEQVRYADNIQAAGNDLLVLINDILDLSKIEAGRMEINPESCSIARLINDLDRVFQPIAMQKKLEFSVVIAPDCPESFVTDRLRLEQVLKNLLSNAFKFTERGRVELRVGPTPDGRLEFAVTDTGIGISAEQQAVVFEAFRQADGKTNRKYGGTGLGLSISRELTRLLGGEIRLTSARAPAARSVRCCRRVIKRRKLRSSPLRQRRRGKSVLKGASKLRWCGTKRFPRRRVRPRVSKTTVAR